MVEREQIIFPLPKETIVHSEQLASVISKSIFSSLCISILNVPYDRRVYMLENKILGNEHNIAYNELN